ncbi:TIGR00659 family protein [Faunimonas pinastri]|uniref:TIGR00659 family protein n=1 Tax=Faunimonas pinastri TaxID=1855383 RepID=A0A1H8ZYL7_9HYPH|nr:LrgB family protein [Faunimonas pinastri]SEP69347.1 TIGR00659 family protein [Faunimonas pinastri]
MSAGLSSTWVYLSTSPLLWLTVTLLAYAAADWISIKAHRNPLASPVVIAVALVILLLEATGTDYETYFKGAQFVNFLLGPATVALGVPLWRNLRTVRSVLVPLGCALVAGGITAMVSAVGIAWLFGSPPEILATVAPKSVTTPIAMAIAETLGGIPSLAAILVLVTGIFGSIIVTPLMNLLRVSDPAARGFAAGLAAHGFGTARAFQVNEIAGTFAGIGMGLNGAFTAIVLSLLSAFFG